VNIGHNRQVSFLTNLGKLDNAKFMELMNAGVDWIKPVPELTLADWRTVGSGAPVLRIT